MDATVTRSVAVQASCEQVWQVVSDLPGMGRFSPETTGGQWSGGATGPALGAVFRGRNARGPRRWSTRSTVTACEPGRAFAFEVSALGMAAALWTYTVTPDGDGCRLTERWQDRRGGPLKRLGRLATGVADRETFTATSIEQTLQRIKQSVERTAA